MSADMDVEIRHCASAEEVRYAIAPSGYYFDRSGRSTVSTAVAAVALYSPDDTKPPSSPSASCRLNVPTLRIFDAGSPKRQISATMPALRKKCSRSSTRPEQGPS